MTKTKATEAIIVRPGESFICLEVGGPALIQNCFNQKAVEEMLKKHMGIETPRLAKKPRECLENATIRNVLEVICMPPIGFKKGMLTAAAAGKSFKKTHLRQYVTIDGHSIPISYERMTPRMDVVRLGMSKTPDIRFRPMFENWKARFIVSFSDAIKVESVVELVNRAGKVGVGEWRPEKDGTFGTYTVLRDISDPKEQKEVQIACAPQLKPLIIPEWAMDVELSPDLMRKIAGSQNSHQKFEDGSDPDVTSQEEGMVGDEVLEQEVA